VAIALATVLAGCQAAATPSPSVVAEPTPTPPPPTADEVIASFLAVTGDPKLTMHVVAHGKVHGYRHRDDRRREDRLRHGHQRRGRGRHGGCRHGAGGT